MADDKFKEIDEAINILDNTEDLVIASLSDIGDVADSSQDKVQAKVDDICERISNQTNDKLSQMRELIIANLKTAYLSSMEIIAILQPLVDMKITDLDSVILALTKIIAMYTQPYKIALEFVTVLTPKLTELSQKVLELATIKDKIKNPVGAENLKLSYDKLNITMEPISIEDITA